MIIPGPAGGRTCRSWAWRRVLARYRPIQGRHRRREVPPGYTGTIVRDGYAGYTHLIDAHHAWCGAHLLRDLAAFARADPDGQFWAAAMADTLIDAHARASAARAAGHDQLAPDVLTDIRHRYRGAMHAGISDNTARAGPLARDALTLARRFRDHEDMILRFVVDLDRALHQQPSGARHPPDQDPATHLRWLPGAPWPASPTSPSSRPTYPPPPNGASTATTS